jgi:hypothetical protein
VSLIILPRPLSLSYPIKDKPLDAPRGYPSSAETRGLSGEAREDVDAVWCGVVWSGRGEAGVGLEEGVVVVVGGDAARLALGSRFPPSPLPLGLAIIDFFFRFDLLLRVSLPPEQQ